MNYLNLAILAALLPFAPTFAGEKPCKEIVNACQAAGYQKGGHSTKKGLYKDCVKPIRKGQSVSGVTLDTSVVQACNAKKSVKSSPSMPSGNSPSSVPVKTGS